MRSVALSARTCAAIRDVLAEQAHAAEALLEAVEHPGGRLGAVEAREQCREDVPVQVGSRTGLVARGHPLTAPLTRPLVIRPCTRRKNTMTGMAMRVEPAMIAAQFVVPFATR